MSVVAIVDIGSTSVGGALVTERPRRGGVNEVCSTIIASSRNEIAFQEQIDLDHFLNGMEAVLKQTLTDLQKQGRESPRQIEIFLSAPFYAAQTVVSRRREIQPFTVTPKLVSELVRSEAAKFERDEHQFIEHKVMQFRLNGYPLTRPYGRQTTDLEVTSYVGIASSRVLNRFREVVQSVFHHRELVWHSFTFAFFSLLNRVLPADRCFLIVDIGGEITELSVLSKGVLRGSTSFPSGRNSLVRSLAQKLHTTSSEAYDRLKLLVNEVQHTQAKSDLLEALTEIKTLWSQSFEDGLGQILSDCLFFDRAYVIGDPTVVSLFRSWIAERSIETLVAGRQPIETETVSKELLNHFCQLESSVAPDPSLMVETIFYDTITGLAKRS